MTARVAVRTLTLVLGIAIANAAHTDLVRDG